MITPDHTALFVAVRAFLLTLVPPGVEVVDGLDNSVPMPVDPFIQVTPSAQARLATNHSVQLVSQERAVKMPTRYNVIMDCYGPDSSDWATTIVAMWRDPYGCEALAAVGAPLYSTDPTQIPLVNGEENYEQRWTITALLQFNPVVTVPQQSATVLDIDLVSVDAEFPPTP